MSVWDALGPSPAALGLAKQLAFGDVPHAWLFVGPSGAGKRPLATAVSAAMNCPEEPGVGCGRCSACLRIMRYRHPDVHHVVPEGPLIPVEVVRDVIVREASRSPFEGTRKVFVIEEAERMNPAAQNALLKTLEEPQADTTFLLLSEHEEELLETVRSRCTVVRLKPLATDGIIEMLTRAGASQEVAALAGRLSDGDYERATAFAFDEEARRRRDLWLKIPGRISSAVEALEVAAAVVEEARTAVKELERAQRLELGELAEAMGEGRGTASVRQSLVKRHRRELRRLEQDVIGECLSSLASFYRDVVALRAGGPSAVANADLLEEIKPWAASAVSNDALLRAVERCVAAAATLPLNANPLLAVESTLLEAARLAPPPARVGA